MILFCPSCGERFEVPGHEEASAAHKCPSCGAQFGDEQAEPKGEGGPPKLKFTSGGETLMEVGVPRRTAVTRGTPIPRRVPAGLRKADPALCEIGSELTSDGAGVLFEARESETGEPVLVRRLLPEGGSVADAQRWAMAATKIQHLRHARMVSVLGVGLRDGSPHVVVERATGQSLAEMSGGRPLNVRQAIQVTLQIVEALTAALGAGSVHGNLKPSNVIVDPQGRARVADFGMLPRAQKDGELVISPHVLGWMPFAAPELIRDGPEAADERSDSYSMGALLYYMLTGKAPFADDDPHGLEAAVLEGTPVAPSNLNAKVPAELDTLILRALEKDPSFRPANAQAIAVELRRIEKLSAHAARKRRPVSAGGGGVGWLKILALLVVVGGIGFGAWFVNRAWKATALSRSEKLLEEARAREGRKGLDDETIGRYREAAENAVGSREEAQYLVEYGKALLRADRSQEASKVLERAAGLRSPAAAEAGAILPAALASAGRADDARRMWEELGASGLDPLVLARSVEAGLDAADRLLHANSADDSLALLEFLEAYLRLGAGKDLPAGVKARTRAALADALAAAGQGEKARAEYVGVLSERTAPETARLRAAEGLEHLASAGVGLKLTPEEMAALAASPLAQARYARTLLVRGHAGQAGIIAGRALAAAKEGTPARAWAELATGEIREASGQLKEAGAHFASAASVATGLDNAVDVVALARVGAARLKLRSGLAAASIREFEGVERDFGTDPRVIEGVAAALVGAGDALRVTSQPGEAGNRYRKVTTTYRAHRPSYLRALSGLGEIQAETRSRQKARETFETLAAQPGAGVYGLIGEMMNGAVGVDELIEAAELEHPDLAARALYCAGLRRELDGKPDQAREYFRRAMELSQERAWYRFLAKQRMQQ